MADDNEKIFADADAILQKLMPKITNPEFTQKIQGAAKETQDTYVKLYNAEKQENMGSIDDIINKQASDKQAEETRKVQEETESKALAEKTCNDLRTSYDGQFANYNSLFDKKFQECVEFNINIYNNDAAGKTQAETDLTNQLGGKQFQKITVDCNKIDEVKSAIEANKQFLADFEKISCGPKQTDQADILTKCQKLKSDYETQITERKRLSNEKFAECAAAGAYTNDQRALVEKQWIKELKDKPFTQIDLACNDTATDENLIAADKIIKANEESLQVFREIKCPDMRTVHVNQFVDTFYTLLNCQVLRTGFTTDHENYNRLINDITATCSGVGTSVDQATIKDKIKPNGIFIFGDEFDKCEDIGCPDSTQCKDLIDRLAATTTANQKLIEYIKTNQNDILTALECNPAQADPKYTMDNCKILRSQLETDNQTFEKQLDNIFDYCKSVGKDFMMWGFGNTGAERERKSGKDSIAHAIQQMPGASGSIWSIVVNDPVRICPTNDPACTGECKTVIDNLTGMNSDNAMLINFVKNNTTEIYTHIGCSKEAVQEANCQDLKHKYEMQVKDYDRLFDEKFQECIAKNHYNVNERSLFETDINNNLVQAGEKPFQTINSIDCNNLKNIDDIINQNNNSLKVFKEIKCEQVLIDTNYTMQRCQNLSAQLLADNQTYHAEIDSIVSHCTSNDPNGSRNWDTKVNSKLFNLLDGKPFYPIYLIDQPEFPKPDRRCPIDAAACPGVECNNVIDKLVDYNSKNAQLISYIQSNKTDILNALECNKQEKTAANDTAYSETASIYGDMAGIMNRVIRKANNFPNTFIVDCLTAEIKASMDLRTKNQTTSQCLVAAPDWTTLLECNANIKKNSPDVLVADRTISAGPCSQITPNYNLFFARGTDNSWTLLDRQTLPNLCTFLNGYLRHNLTETDTNTCIKKLCEFKKNNPNRTDAQNAYNNYSRFCTDQ